MSWNVLVSAHLFRDAVIQLVNLYDGLGKMRNMAAKLLNASLPQLLLKGCLLSRSDLKYLP